MVEVSAKLTESVIKQIMEGADPRAAIDSALDEKAGYHKEKRIRGGKAQVVNVKNTKRKVHHTLTADQKKAIKKAHSAAANKKRAKSLKKGAKMGLYQGAEIRGKVQKESMMVAEEEEEKAFVLTCPACSEGELDFFVDPETGEKDESLLVCSSCGETFVIVSTSELEDDDDDDKEEDAKEEDEDAEEEKAEEEAPQDESAEAPAEAAPVAEEAPVAEDCSGDDCEGAECGEPECGEPECGEPETESGLFFEEE